MNEPVLAVEGLCVAAAGRDAPLVSMVSFTVPRAGVLALVGESGSGKTLTLRAVLGLLPPQVDQTAGTIAFGDGITAPRPLDPVDLRGNGLAMILQEPTTSLNPTMRVGDIVGTAPRLRNGLSRKQARKLAIDLLDEVGIRDAAGRVDSWPHELSGGMRQRVMIAMALATDPTVLLCDEPTTALDVTVQAQIVRTLNRLRAERGLALVFVTHDLALTAQLCDDVCVLRNGRVVERGGLEAVYRRPQDDYTRALLAAVPRLDARPSRPPIIGSTTETVTEPTAPSPLVIVEGLTVTFDQPTPVGERMRGGHRKLTAVDGVSFTIGRGQSIAVVGESGSGKSTVARVISGLLAPTSGSVVIDRAAGRVQMVFQDPSSSLDPRQRAGDSIDEVLRHHRLVPSRGIVARRDELFTIVGLDPALASVLPRRLSGGQKQRVAIARALALEPRLLIADEAVASLDVSIKASIVQLLRRLQRELGLALLFITHDLALVPDLCDEVLVMHEGRIVERGKASDVIADPRDPYTAALVSAVPRLPAGVA